MADSRWGVDNEQGTGDCRQELDTSAVTEDGRVVYLHEPTFSSSSVMVCIMARCCASSSALISMWSPPAHSEVASSLPLHTNADSRVSQRTHHRPVLWSI